METCVPLDLGGGLGVGLFLLASAGDFCALSNLLHFQSCNLLKCGFQQGETMQHCVTLFSTSTSCKVETGLEDTQVTKHAPLPTAVVPLSKPTQLLL